MESGARPSLLLYVRACVDDSFCSAFLSLVPPVLFHSLSFTVIPLVSHLTMSSSLDHEHSSTTPLVPSPQAQEVDVVVESSSMPAFHPPPSEVSTPLRTSSFDLQALTESMQTPTTEHREEVFKRLLARIAELERQRDATILKGTSV